MQMQFQGKSSTTFFQINKQTKMGERIDSTSTKSQFFNLDLTVLKKIIAYNNLVAYYYDRLNQLRKMMNS